MKKVKFLFICLGILLGFSSCIASLNTNSSPRPNYAGAQGTYRASVPFIFIEQGVEFAIYPNGEFDFAYVGHNYNQNPYRNTSRSFSYNGGYNYDMYLQFDRFGAVIQVENVPIYYDYYGRISQAGSIPLRYQGDVVTQIGNMHIIYERGNVYLGSSGYVNNYNINIIVRPWHAYYVIPHYHIVYTTPYRRNYSPARYSYTEHVQRYNNRGKNNYDNGRREFIDPVTQLPRRGESINTGRDNNTNTPNRGRDNTTTNPREQNTNQVQPGRGSSNSSNSTTNGRGEAARETGSTRENTTNNTTNRREQSTSKEQTQKQPANTQQPKQEATKRETSSRAKQNTKSSGNAKPTTTNTNRGRSSSSTGQTSNRGR